MSKLRAETRITEEDIGCLRHQPLYFRCLPGSTTSITEQCFSFEIRFHGVPCITFLQTAASKPMTNTDD